jgi:hypothetical protein
MSKGTIPESLFNGDPNANVFYVLVDQSVVTCKKATDQPFYKQRSSYISSGVYSPAQNKVIFWGDAQEVTECMKILVDSKTINEDTTYELASGHKMLAGSNSSAQIKTAVGGITRKGHAGFNRLPAKGTDKLKPQASTTASKPNISQQEMPPANHQGVVIPTPSGKIEIRTGSNKDLRQQNVAKRITPRNT